MSGIRSSEEQAAWNAAQPPHAKVTPPSSMLAAPKRNAGRWLATAALLALGVGVLLLWQGRVHRFDLTNGCQDWAFDAKQAYHWSAVQMADQESACEGMGGAEHMAPVPARAQTPASAVLAPAAPFPVVAMTVQQAFDRCRPHAAEFAANPLAHGESGTTDGWYTDLGISTDNVALRDACASGLLGQAGP
jgi:hypothetical protein